MSFSDVLTSPNVEDDAAAITCEEAFLDGPTVAVRLVSKPRPRMRHEDVRDLIRPENEERVLQNRDEGGHKGRTDSNFEEFEVSKGRGESHEVRVRKQSLRLETEAEGNREGLCSTTTSPRRL